MKNIKLQFVMLTFLFSIGIIAQNLKQKPWSNHPNYKEEVFTEIKKSAQLEIIDKAFNKRKTTNNQQNRTFTDFDFVNGVNIAWINFGRDIGMDSNGTEYHPDLIRFSDIMDQVKNAGGNVIRWWYHTNGSTNPVFNNNGLVAPNPTFFKTDLLAILNLAASKGVKIQICLWSFDMLKGGQWNVNSARNKNIIVSSTHLQSYLDNALIPLVNAVGNHPGLYAWEIFNEPEGMTLQYASNWSGFTDRVTMNDIQSMINRTASAIKNTQPNVKVTNGALGFVTATDNNSNGYINQYTNQKLIAAGGQANGVLDFYNIHYYDWAGTNGSPFHNDFNNTSLDKPTVIAEYYPINTFGISSADLGTTLLQKGWNGSLLWSITDKPWNDIKPVIENIFQALQNNTTPPVTTCNAVSNSTSNFVLRNAWSDQNNGSSLNNSNDDLIITHRQWGKTDLSLISSAKYPITAGKEYIISFDFKDNPDVNLNKIEIGFASSYDYSGAILLQPSVNSTAGFSNTYKAHTATITATNSGQIELALKLFWNNQPNNQVSYYIKNIKICESQNNNMPPVTTCDAVSNSTSNFVLRNAWSDQNNGSSLNNSNGDLIITHRQWGKTDLSLISLAKYPITAGKEYIISFDFKDNPDVNLNKIEIGFASGYDYSGAILLQPSVNSTAGFSNTYKTHTATITATNSGQIELALKLFWNNQPNNQVSYYIKNIEICEKMIIASKVEQNLSDIENEIKLFPNPTSGKFNLQLPKHTTYKIFDSNGNLIKENNNALPVNVINLESYKKGIYLIRIINGENEVYKKIIIE